MDFSLMDELIINPFDIHEDEGIMDDIDPDCNYYNNTLLSPPKTQYYTPDCLNKVSKPSKLTHFSMLHVNIRSTKKNFAEFNLLLTQLTHQFSILAVTESWLKPHNVELFSIKGYNHEYSIRPKKQGGGISLYIQENIDYYPRPDLNYSDDELEILWLELDKRTVGSNKNILYGCVYRRPDTDIQEFNERYASTLDTIQQENKLIYCVGDFNIDLLKHQTHIPTNEFININFSHSLNPLINKPTRITDHSATLIDNFLTNNISSDNDISGIIPVDMSDHYPIVNIHYFEAKPTIPTTKKKKRL